MSNRRDVRLEFTGALQLERHSQFAVCLRTVSLTLALAACNSTASNAAPSASTKPSATATSVSSAQREPNAKAVTVVTSVGDTKAPSAPVDPTTDANKVAASAAANAPGTKPA